MPAKNLNDYAFILDERGVREAFASKLAPAGSAQKVQKRCAMSQLLEPYTLRQLTLLNRIAVSPMCQYSSENGLANDWHLVHLGSRAVGGAGLIFTEATAVTADGRITAQDLGL
ncbi:hypothetical protein SB912_24395, partial [Pantoea sp. SIMBA_072]